MIGPGMSVQLDKKAWHTMMRATEHKTRVCGIEIRTTKACPKYLVVLVGVGGEVVAHCLSPPED